MKSADNFNPGKWLVENKITTQSKLNENNILIPYKKIYDVLANEKIRSADYNEIEKYLDIKNGNFDWEIKNALSKIYTQNKVDDIMDKITSQSSLNEINETVTKDEIVAAIKLMNSAAEAAGFQLHGKINTNPGKRFTTHAIWTMAGEQHSDSQYPSKAVYLVWSKPTGLYVSASKGGTFPISGTPQEWSDKIKWEKAF